MVEQISLFADRLRERMDELGVKPGELAGAVGVSISAVLQWLGGATKGLKPENLFAVSDALGVEARWLGTGKGPRELPVAGKRTALFRDSVNVRKRTDRKVAKSRVA